MYILSKMIVIFLFGTYSIYGHCASRCSCEFEPGNPGRVTLERKEKNRVQILISQVVFSPSYVGEAVDRCNQSLFYLKKRKVCNKAIGLRVARTYSYCFGEGDADFLKHNTRKHLKKAWKLGNRKGFFFSRPRNAFYDGEFWLASYSPTTFGKIKLGESYPSYELEEVSSIAAYCISLKGALYDLD